MSTVAQFGSGATSFGPNRIFSLTAFVGLIVGFTRFGSVTSLLFLQVVGGASPTAFELQMLPVLGGMLLISIGSDLLIGRWERYKDFPLDAGLPAHGARPGAPGIVRRRGESSRAEAVVQLVETVSAELMVFRSFIQRPCVAANTSPPRRCLPAFSLVDSDPPGSSQLILPTSRKWIPCWTCSTRANEVAAAKVDGRLGLVLSWLEEVLLRSS